MGLSSSQCRLLSLTARKSDLEFQGQQINQRRLILSNQEDQLATDYSNALSNRKIQHRSTDGTFETVVGNHLFDLGNGSQITTYSDKDNNIFGFYKITKDADNNLNGYQLVNMQNLTPDEIAKMIQTGNYALASTVDSTANPTPAQVNEFKTHQVNLNSIYTSQGFSSETYTEDDYVEGEKYTAQSDLIHREDRVLELELKNVDTQHQAVQTEIDAVKKVIDKNIDGTFKTFNA